MPNYLELRRFEPENKNIAKLSVEYRGGYGRNSLKFTLSKEDILCANKDKIVKALIRRGEDYFKGVENHSNSIVFKIGVSQTPLTGHTLSNHIIKAREEGEKAFKNTLDDVFGVGCVEVE